MEGHQETSLLYAEVKSFTDYIVQNASCLLIRNIDKNNILTIIEPRTYFVYKVLFYIL